MYKYHEKQFRRREQKKFYVKHNRKTDGHIDKQIQTNRQTNRQRD